MSQVKDALDKARSSAQALHMKVQGTTAKDHAAIRAGAAVVAVEAQELARSIKDLLQNQHVDAKQHLKDALVAAEAASAGAKEIATASDAELKSRRAAAIGRVRSVAQKLSLAVAAKRAALVKV